MVIKKIFLMLSLLAPTISYTNENMRSELKVRGSAFIPTDCLFRDIYGSAAGNFDIEFATRAYKWLQAWANFSYFSKDGESLCFCDCTSINVPAFSLGLKGRYEFKDWVACYAGLGLNIARIRIKDHSSFSGTSCCSETAVGCVVKSGCDFYFTERGFVDLFLDYAYQKAEFQKEVNASGVRIGAGLGVRF